MLKIAFTIMLLVICKYLREKFTEKEIKSCTLYKNEEMMERRGQRHFKTVVESCIA